MVVADDTLARAGLAALLAGQQGCEVVGQVSSAEVMTQAIAVHRPDVMLWDLGWQPERAMTALANVAGERSVPIVAILASETDSPSAWSAGARGLLLRQASPQQIAVALGAAALGLSILDPTLAPALPPRREDTSPGLPEQLTPREIDVLKLMAEGLPNKSIASRLGISEHTVKFHVNAILGKLGVQSRTEAVVQATRLGLVLL
jgi:DNA-binding NarL/FixJ family response regulator